MRPSSLRRKEQAEATGDEPTAATISCLPALL